jgi:hypothetical protein
METQIVFYKDMTVSAGLYSSENCELTEKDGNRIQAVEIFYINVGSNKTM